MLSGSFAAARHPPLWSGRAGPRFTAVCGAIRGSGHGGRRVIHSGDVIEATGGLAGSRENGRGILALTRQLRTREVYAPVRPGVDPSPVGAA
jgi:hypothetical protein